MRRLQLLPLLAAAALLSPAPASASSRKPKPCSHVRSGTASPHRTRRCARRAGSSTGGREMAGGPALVGQFPQIGFGTSVNIPGGGGLTFVQAIPLQATPTLREIWSFTRLHYELPVLFVEKELEKETQTVEQSTIFKTELEAKERFENVGGFPQIEFDTVAATFTSPFQVTEKASEQKLEGTKLKTRTVTTTETSTLPVTMQLIFRLVSRGVVLWSNPVPCDIHYAVGTFGVENSVRGTGYIEGYADLVNPLGVVSGEPLELQVWAQVPSRNQTQINYPFVIAKEGSFGEASQASYALYYDVLDRRNMGQR